VACMGGKVIKGTKRWYMVKKPKAPTLRREELFWGAEEEKG